MPGTDKGPGQGAPTWAEALRSHLGSCFWRSGLGGGAWGLRGPGLGAGGAHAAPELGALRSAPLPAAKGREAGLSLLKILFIVPF